MHNCSWESMCWPKSVGGLSIRKLENLCTAAGLKLFWRCFNAEGIWASWMKTTYRPNLLPWDASTSGTWKHIISSKNLAQLHITTDDNNHWLCTVSSTGKFTFSSAWNVSRVPSLFPPSDMVWCQFTCP